MSISIENFIPISVIDTALQAAFAEDLGGYGDITTMATIDPAQNARAHFVARQSGIIAGIEIARRACRYLDSNVNFVPSLSDGKPVEPGQKIATISGNAAAILSSERVALNFLCHMSGIASMTNQFVKKIEGTKAKICCTRKTRPLLRAFEKYAVRAGGGSNHRFNLSDAVLIKDNHIASFKSIREAVLQTKEKLGHMVRIEVEVDRIDQIDDVIAGGADAILLDNMTPDQLRAAVQRIDGRLEIEASGGVTLDSVRAIAETGVDFISVGRITHSAPWLDIGLDFEAL